MTLGDNYPEDTDGFCPICNTLMERGFIIGRDGILWNRQPAQMRSDEEVMGPEGQDKWGYQSIEAYRCRKCRIIRYLLFNHDDITVRERCPTCGTWHNYLKKAHEDEKHICRTCKSEF